MADEDEQSYELIRAVAAQDDFELAYRLQLQEAMAVSCSVQQNLFQQAHAQDKTATHPPSPDDRALALALQNEELYKSQIEEQDRSLMTHDIEQLQVELKRRTHDAAFAKALMDMDDSEWEAHGNLQQSPFNAHSAPGPTGTSSDFCKLHITVASSENKIDENNAQLAMGAVIFDSQNNVLLELKKSFEPGTNKAMADYMALLAGLQIVHGMGFQHIEAHTDSVLLYNQVTNRWRVRSRKMQALWSQAREYVHNLPVFHMFLEPRNLNQHAVRLAREALGGVRSGEALRSEVDNKQTCTICLESKYQAEMVKILGCSHEFCNKCLVQHAEVKVQSGQVPVGCPQVDCTAVLSLDHCQSLLSQRWYELLQKRLIEASIPEAERVYCPYSNCSALMDRSFNVNSVTSAASSSRASTCKMCAECARLFCVECRVPWHVSMTCDYYQSLPPEFRDKQDAELHRLAANQKWQRCKKCRRMIELSEGCYHMTCRCGYEFCYLCGKDWKGKDGTCSCQLWDERYLLERPAPVPNNGMMHILPDEVETESYDDDIDFDEVDGRADFVFVSNPSNPLYKTRLCRHWSAGVCFAGRECNFAHGSHELRWIG